MGQNDSTEVDMVTKNTESWKNGMKALWDRRERYWMEKMSTQIKIKSGIEPSGASFMRSPVFGFHGRKDFISFWCCLLTLLSALH